MSRAIISSSFTEFDRLPQGSLHEAVVDRVVHRQIHCRDGIVEHDVAVEGNLLVRSGNINFDYCNGEICFCIILFLRIKKAPLRACKGANFILLRFINQKYHSCFQTFRLGKS